MGMVMSDLAGKSLDELADLIRQSLAGYSDRNTPRSEWEDHAFMLCQAIVAAYEQFDANINWGRWMKRHGLVLSKGLLEAARRFHADPRLREYLADLSLRSLHTLNIRFARHKAKMGMSMGMSDLGEHIQLCLEAYDELKAEGAVITERAVWERARVSRTPAMKAMAIRYTEERLAVERLSETAQQRFDRLLAKKSAELEARLRLEIAHEMNNLWEERVVRHYAEKVVKADAAIAAHKGIFTKAEWRKLLAFVHSDKYQDPETKAKADELFKIIQPLESVLLIVPPPPTRSQREGVAPVPSTVEEMMGRMRFYQQQQKAARDAAKANRASS